MKSHEFEIIDKRSVIEKISKYHRSKVTGAKKCIRCQVIMYILRSSKINIINTFLDGDKDCDMEIMNRVYD